MNYIKIILENTASNGLSGRIVEGFDSFKRYNRGKNLVKVELKNFELDPGERLEVGFVQCNESGQPSEAVETVSFAPSLMSTTDDPKVYVAKVPNELFVADAEYYNIEIRRVSYADVDGVGDELEVDTLDSASVGPVAVSARSLTREGTEPNVGDFVVIQNKVDNLAKLCAPYKTHDLLSAPDDSNWVDISAIKPSDGLQKGDFLLYENKILYRVKYAHTTGAYVQKFFVFDEYVTEDYVEEVETFLNNCYNDMFDTVAELNDEVTRNLQNGMARGSVQQAFWQGDNAPAGAIASGEGAVALGGQRYDKVGKSLSEEPPTEAKGVQSFAHGGGVIVEGDWSAGFGKDTRTHQRASHSEGGGTIAGLTYEEWLKANNKSSSQETHVEYLKSYGFAHAEGEVTMAKGRAAHSEGNGTQAIGAYSHAEGSFTIANGVGAHAEGVATEASGLYSHAENYNTQAIGAYSHAEGMSVKAVGAAAHAEGSPNQDGTGGQALAEASHTEGYGCETAETANASHAEGYDTKTLSKYAHAEGTHTIAGIVSDNPDDGVAAHAEGHTTVASGEASHAQNKFTEASADGASAAGFHTKAGYANQFVVGEYNENKKENIFEVGGGSHEDDRKNAFEVRQDGSAAYVGGKKLLTEDDSTGSSSGGTQLYYHQIFGENAMPFYIISTRGTAYTSYHDIFHDYVCGKVLFMGLNDGMTSVRYVDVAPGYEYINRVDYLKVKYIYGTAIYEMNIDYAIADYTPTKL